MSRSLTLRFVFGLIFAVALFALIETGEANYRKTPFNGSIFGKRGTAEFDATPKALSAMCEIAAEACSPFYVTQDK
ncbi:SIFamide-related peptide [Eumeta japonica]|uniref:SIFamide-related peptide n=1 Tax=Eumeta variegata TaxID=151549 RepID=A0A4C1W3W8_EUMVA|nr:SIFamide-related peptide [Eumeta japonica]